jgi:hypothetical protein
MMRKYFFALLIFQLLLAAPRDSFSQSKNVIKTSVIPIFLKDYSLYFERRIHKNISFSIGGSYMPERGLPSAVTNFSGGSSVDLSKISFSGLSITPEIRIFPGLKLRHPAPHGFYISLYVKVRSYQVDFPYAYNDSTTFDFSGKFTGVGIGMMLGHQWIIKDRFSIDWWISGVHFGNLYSTFEVTDDKLSSISQNDFIEKLGKISFPQGDINTEVSGSTAKITINAPYVGLRSGFTLGVAF